MSRPSDPLDTWLLRVLETLLSERSVSRTAIRLRQSQPAISAARKRLRVIFNDELLVRDKGGMVTTGRESQLLAHARLAVSEIDKLLVPPETFEPTTAQQSFRIGMPDYLATTFLAGVVERVRREAPASRLIVHGLWPSYDFENALAEAELDVVIGNWPDPPQGLHLGLILEDEVVCVMGEQHPLARKGLSVEAYLLRAQHVVPTPYAMTQLGVVDTRLATRRRPRDARVMLPFSTSRPP